MNDTQLLLGRVSDQDLREAYQNRFTLKTGEVLDNSRKVADHLATLLAGRTRETFLVVFLNRRNALLSTEILFEGTLTQAVIFPREIVKYALLKNAAAIICGHNHPSGEVKPSGDDQAITRKIKLACQLVDIQLLDHLIIANGEFFSFADKGLL